MEPTMPVEAILRNVSKHIQLTPEESDLFVGLMQHKLLKRKEYLLRPGEICKTESFIIKGCLRIYSIDENGTEHILLFGVEDWWIGDLFSFLTAMPTNYCIDALEDSEVLQISRQNLEILYDRVPKFERFFRIIIQNAFIAQQNRIYQNLSLTAEQRYLEFINKYPLLEQRIPQKQVASYLGITPVFLSMLRRKLAGR